MNGWTEQRSARTHDGRTLAIELAGDADGFPVLVHHGTPNTRHLYAPEAAEAASQGLKLIGYSRPGYGESTRLPGRTVADCADDVLAICDELGIGRLAMWGASGGGPHVLACAALLPGLVTAVASLASITPYPAEGLDWFDGIGEHNGADFKRALTDPQAERAAMEKERAEWLAASPEALTDGLTEVPAEMLGELAEYISLAFHDGLATGIDGYWDDYQAFLKPWGFELGDITVPVLLMHGRLDRSVPISHGEWLAARVPGAEVRFLSNEGHMSILANRMDEVHAWLGEHR
jgi:pimeloyl-ACP methyl ester carboxylesterase